MEKDFFYFKGFYLNQYQAALKICTDSCLYGGWLAQKLISFPRFKNCYEMGTGLGILSFMIAYKNKQLSIHALDIDSHSITLAQENKIYCQPFSKNINFIHQDCTHYHPLITFDFIFSNPPFYKNELFSMNEIKNLTKHQHLLNYAFILKNISQLLTENGSGSLLIPDKYFSLVLELIHTNLLYLEERLIIYDYEQGKAIRNFLWFSKNERATTSTKKVFIRTSKAPQSSYHQSFSEIMKDFSPKLI